MCGIAGAVGIRCGDTTVRNMLRTMERRGPDQEGTYQKDDCTLLHRRLCVIDPDGGRQPMHLNFGSENYTIIYNGELYNTNEVRQLLQKLGHCFKTTSDTEVLLHAYAQWEEQCLYKLNGIFAFAVWEHKRRKLFLARDRIGVKPLFYTLREKGILFASEIKTLLAHPDVTAKIDTIGITQLLMLAPGRVPGSGVLKDIAELEPGCCGYFMNGKFVRKRYWKLRDREHNESFEETADHVRELVVNAIERQMVSDVPIGTFLSGGLDSSLISSVCAEKLKANAEQLITFSVDYENNDRYFVPGKFQPNSDNSYIEIMCKYLGSNHHWSVLDAGSLAAALDDAVQARDLPGMADVDSSLLLFCGKIREHVTVALSGECADEIFGGYPWYRDPEIRATEGFPWSQNLRQRMECMHPQFRNGQIPLEYVSDLYRDTISSCDILPGTAPLEKRMKEMVNLNQCWFMQTLLDRKDRMSMYHGLEVRVPFCDHRIAEYLYGVPWSFKDYQGKEKGLLRYAMRDYLPETVLNRKKSPYPKTFDPQYLDIVSKRLREILLDKDSPILQIVSIDALRSLLETEHSWPWYGQLMRKPQTIAHMLQINSWLDTYKVEILL